MAYRFLVTRASFSTHRALPSQPLLPTVLLGFLQLLLSSLGPVPAFPGSVCVSAWWLRGACSAPPPCSPLPPPAAGLSPGRSPALPHIFLSPRASASELGLSAGCVSFVLLSPGSPAVGVTCHPCSNSWLSSPYSHLHTPPAPSCHSLLQLQQCSKNTFYERSGCPLPSPEAADFSSGCLHAVFF